MRNKRVKLSSFGEFVSFITKLITIIVVFYADNEGDGDSGRGDSNASCNSDCKEEEFPDHLSIDKEFTLRVTILQALDIPSDYADVFCQFK